ATARATVGGVYRVPAVGPVAGASPAGVAGGASRGVARSPRDALASGGGGARPLALGGGAALSAERVRLRPPLGRSSGARAADSEPDSAAESEAVRPARGGR